jgi:hypothetical protein
LAAKVVVVVVVDIVIVTILMFGCVEVVVEVVAINPKKTLWKGLAVIVAVVAVCVAMAVVVVYA